MDKVKVFINKNKKPVFIGLSALVLISFIGMSVLGFFLFSTNNQLKNRNEELSNTKQTLSTTESELNTTKEAKAKLETENASLNQRIAELTANTTKLEADMAAKQAELQTVNANLAGAQKCVSLFDSVKGQLVSYNSNLEKSGELVWQAIEAASNGNNAQADSLIQQAINYSNKATANYNSMNGTLNKIKSGKC